MAGKTNKSYTKRLKLTKSGKVIARKSGVNHFNAKKSRKRQMAQKRSGMFILSHEARGRFLGK